MSEMTPDLRLLKHLEPFGIGYYHFIDDILNKIFSREDYIDFSNSRGNTRIWKFLNDLRRHDFIEFMVVDNIENFNIKAAIQPKGIEYLNHQSRSFGGLRLSKDIKPT